MSFKKRATFLIVMVLTLSMLFLVACGDGQKDGSNKTPDKSGDDDINTGSSDSGDDGPEEKAEVVLWNRIFEDWNREHFEGEAEEFNETNAGVEIMQEFIPGDAWDEKMKSAQAAGTAPDIYLINYAGIIYSAKDGLIRELNDVIPQDAWDDLYDNVLEFVTYDGKQYAYPQLVEPATVLYYRKDLFEEAGLDPESPPKTWDELIEYAKILTKDDVFGLSFPGFGPDMGWSTWGWQYASSGHLAISDDWSQATVEDAGYVDLINFVKRLYDEKVIPEQPLAGYADVKPFGEGSLAMTFCGSWAIGQLKNEYPEMVENVGVAVAPTKDGNQDTTTSTVGGWTYVVDAKSEKAKEAGEYIYWLLGSDPERPAKFFKVAQYSKYPPRKSVDDFLKEDPEAGQDEWMKIVSEGIVPYAIGEPIYAWDISMAVANAYEDAVLNGVSAEEALKTAADDINKFIQDNDYSNQKPN